MKSSCFFRVFFIQISKLLLQDILFQILLRYRHRDVLVNDEICFPFSSPPGKKRNMEVSSC